VNRDVVVVGGGVIGLSIAWRLAQQGLGVSVVDERPGGGASSVAAGMLAPVTEVHYGEEDQLALALASARAWPGFAAALEAVTGAAVGYRTVGTLLVGLDADDTAVLDELFAFQRRLGLDVERLRGRACRELEPLLAPRVRGGLHAPGDHQVDPRCVVAALLAACEQAGVEFLRDRAARMTVDQAHVRSVVLGSGTAVYAAHVVLAAGCWSGQIEGLPPPARPSVRPVKGQILRLRARRDLVLPALTIRGLVRGRSVYLVPREDGELVVGATQEEQGFDTSPTAGAVRELLTDAAAVVPQIDELELVEVAAGLRPGTLDNAPIVGPTEVDGLLLATGHYRNGVLLAPITAAAIAALVAGGPVPAEMAVADPRRDGRAARAAEVRA
jgi:glycine oxidase